MRLNLAMDASVLGRAESREHERHPHGVLQVHADNSCGDCSLQLGCHGSVSIHPDLVRDLALDCSAGDLLPDDV